ncbi:MAG: dephospho-CoA kinase [Candidatus Nitrospinota bacterium M3_3B_026]
MPLIGLTGGYATGKSSVCSMLVKMGAELIDCDLLAREVVAPGTDGLKKVAERFGEDVMNPDGTLNRRELADIIFTDAESRRGLEAILHPLIRELVFKRAKERLSRDPGAVVVVEAALLFESGLYEKMDKNIVVTCREDQQIERGMARDGLPKAEVIKRMNAQWPLSRKAELADFVIDNSGAVEKTKERVREIWAGIAK